MQLSRLTAFAAGCLLVGLGLALLLFVFWLHAPSDHTANALWYLVSSGLLSLLVGGLALVAAARYLPSIGMKIAAATLAGGAAAVINVVVTPLLMFKERSDFDILVITLLFFILIAIAFALFVASVIGRQVRDLTVAAGRVAAGELGFQVSVAGRDEVAVLAGSFNRMSEELLAASERRTRMEQERRDLVAAISHDLRTPLSSIRAMVESVQDGVVTDPDAVHRYLAAISRETEHLNRLIDDLFELARIESGNLDLHPAEVDLHELLSDAVESFRARAERKEIRLELRGSNGTAKIDAVRMQRVLENLIENALQHSPPGGSVEVELLRRNGDLEVAVSDAGSGIPREEHERVFERFYRSERSRSRASGGAGLGLAIARGLVEAQGGRIRVESEPPKGARFVITL